MVGLEDAGNSAGFNQPRGYSTLPAATWLSEHVSPNFVRETYEAIHSASQQVPLVGAALDSVGCNFCIPHDRTALAAIEKTLQTHGTKLALTNPLMWTALVALGAPGAVRALTTTTANDDKFVTSDPRLAAWQTKLAAAPSGAPVPWTGSGTLRVTGMKVGGAQFVDVNANVLTRAGTLTASVSQVGGSAGFDGTVKLLTWDEGTPALCAVATQDQPVADTSRRRTASVRTTRGITKATLQLSAGSQANATYVIGLHFTPLRASDPEANATGSGCRESAQNLHARSIAAGGSQTCAITDDATAAAGPTVRCWGINFSGELGDGLTNAFENGPMGSVILPRPPIKVVTGGANSCALLDDHSVSCWGSNNFGQLGVSNTQAHGPVTIDGTAADRKARTVVMAPAYVCVLDGNATVRCAGGINGYNPTDLVHLVALDNSSSIAVNSSSICAVRAADGRLRCGDLGLYDWLPAMDLAVTEKALPARVTELVGADFHFCARTTASGSVRCWGDNWAGAVGTRVPPIYGQLGNYAPIPEPLFVGTTGEAGTSTVCGYARNCY
jgi:hypothetical protein